MTTTESQKKAQAKYLANPENKAKTNMWNREYSKNYVYERSEEQKERNRIYARERYYKTKNQLKVCLELLKYEEIQNFMAKMNELSETAEKLKLFFLNFLYTIFI